MYPLITLETYSDMFLDYSQGIENTNYDNEIREFTVPYAWLSKEFKQDNFGTFDLDWFLCNEYDWDDTWFLYERATADKVIVSERIVDR